MALDEGIERDADDLEARVEQYEEDAEEARNRIGNIEQAMDALRDDVVLLERLEPNLLDAEQDEWDVSVMHDQLSWELKALEERVEREIETLRSERDVIDDLASIGEDVSETMGILDVREARLESCQEQLASLAERLDGALDFYDLSDALSTDGSMRPKEEAGAKPPAQIADHVRDYLEGRVANLPAPELDARANPSAGSPQPEGLAINSPGMGYYAVVTQGMRDEARRASPDYEITRGTFPLARTLEPMRRLPDGGTLYDTPEMQSRKLNWCQGLYSDHIQGDCGLCSVQNVARMGRKQLTERDVVELALRHDLCEKRPTVSPGRRGATDPASRRELLSLIGIPSHLDSNHNLYHIADLVESGRGVIASVEVRNFWHGSNITNDQAGGHAVVITSVSRDAQGNPVWFHLCDSGLRDANYTVDADQLRRSLRPGRELNVTDDIIR